MLPLRAHPSCNTDQGSPLSNFTSQYRCSSCNIDETSRSHCGHIHLATQMEFHTPTVDHICLITRIRVFLIQSLYRNIGAHPATQMELQASIMSHIRLATQIRILPIRTLHRNRSIYLTTQMESHALTADHIRLVT